MLKPLTKLRRTFDNGFGIFYYSGTSERADHPLSDDDVLDELDEIIDRLNVLSDLENKRASSRHNYKTSKDLKVAIRNLSKLKTLLDEKGEPWFLTRKIPLAIELENKRKEKKIDSKSI